MAEPEIYSKELAAAIKILHWAEKDFRPVLCSCDIGKPHVIEAKDAAPTE